MIENIQINLLDNFILKKKKLIEITKNLSKLEYLEIFNIICENNCQYSENKNGIFINLSNISETTIDKIFNFLNFISLKKEDLIKHEEIINNAKKNILGTNKNIENNLYNKKEEYLEYFENDDDDVINLNNTYLSFSSDEDEDLENKITLKKKKIRYTGKKAKIIKSIKNIKENNDSNKNRSKKIED
jgi:hypothetical protein